MDPVRVALVSGFTPMGGGSKLAALLFQHMDRRWFDPSMLSGGEMTEFAEEYGIPEDRRAVCDMTDPGSVARALRGCDVVVSLVGCVSNLNEYDVLWRSAETASVKLRVLYAIIALGNAAPGMADLILCCSMDTLLRGTPCAGCHVAYPALPRRREATRRLRTELGIPEDAFVVAHVASEERPEFYQAAAAFVRREKVVFLSALARSGRWAVPSNVRFCGCLRQRDMPAIYDAADVILHARTESFGYAVYQAMAANRPVVALWTSSNNAFAETMWPDGGYLARDVQGMIAAVEHVIENREEARARAATAMARIERLVPEAAVPRFEELILRGLREKGALPADAPGGGSRAQHWPGPEEIRRWTRARSDIEAELRGKAFV